TILCRWTIAREPGARGGTRDGAPDSFPQWADLDLAEEDLGAFGLELDLSLGLARLRPDVDEVAVDDIGYRVACADHLHAVPLAGRLLDVVLAPETQHVLPRGVAAPPVDPR